MTLSQRLAQLGARSVSQPRGIGSSWSWRLINRRQCSQDSKIESEASELVDSIIKESSYQPSPEAIARVKKYLALKRKAPPSPFPDEVESSVMLEAEKREIKFLLGDDGVSAAVKSFNATLVESSQRMAADVAYARKEFRYFCMGTLALLTLMGGVTLAEPYISPLLVSDTHDDDQSKPLCPQCSKPI